MRIGTASGLMRLRSQAFPRKNLSYLNGISLRSEMLSGLSAVDPGALVWIQSFINQHVQEFHNVANNSYSYNVRPAGPQNTAIGQFTVNGKAYFYSPSGWPAGGGGFARLPPEKAAALGGVPVTVPEMRLSGNYGNWTTTPAATGYVFDYNPGGALAPGAANPNVGYTPGTGGDFVKTVAPLAIVAALPFAAAAITAATAAGAAGAGASAAAGAIMPGAAAAASGATGGLVSAGGAAGAAGSGLTTAGVVSAVKTASGLVQQAASAGGVVAKVANLVTQHSDAANALATTAQQQADAGNVAAAAALQNQAQQNALMAQEYQQQLQTSLFGSSIGGVPVWALLSGAGLLLVGVTVLLTKRK